MSCKKMTALCLYPLFMEGRIIENPREKSKTDWRLERQFHGTGHKEQHCRLSL